MSRINSVAKNLSSRVIAQLLAIVQQVGLVPVFIHGYGTQRYGEWLALSAAVQYLNTLDFGVQTFVNQDLTLRYQRGDMDAFHVRQSTALRLLLAVVMGVATACLGAFLLPLQGWLRLDGSDGSDAIPPFAVSLTIYFLSLQVLTATLFNYTAGTFMVIGRAHIGGYWSNIQRFLSLGISSWIVLERASFSTLALGQLSTLLLCLIGALVHLRYVGPQIFPSLRHWDSQSIPEVLKQSGYFGLIYSSNFLVYQLPVIIMQRDVGPGLVVTFTIMRTIFSMSRQCLNGITQSLGPEITNLYAISDWKGLRKLYDYSERLIFTCIPIVNIGTFFISPLILSLWLHKPTLFVEPLYAISAAISTVNSAKEHKFQFQFSTNTHIALGRFMFASYLALVLTTVVVVPSFGLQGFLWTWLFVECLQLAYIIRLNQRMFAKVSKIPTWPLIKLVVLSTVTLTATIILIPNYLKASPFEQATLTACVVSVVFAISWPLFSLGPLIHEFSLRFGKTRASAS